MRFYNDIIKVRKSVKMLANASNYIFNNWGERKCTQLFVKKMGLTTYQWYLVIIGIGQDPITLIIG